MSQKLEQGARVAPSMPKRRRGWLKPTVIIVVFGGGLFALYDVYKDDIWPKKFGEVVPGLVYRSGQISPRIIEKTLQEKQIKTLINLQVDVRNSDPLQAAEMEAAQRLGIDCYRYALAGDGTGNIVNYADALEKLVASERAGKPVLIHCAAGTQRTGVAIAFYRVLVQNRPASQAYAEMLSYGLSPRKDMNAIQYLNDHMAELGKLLIERGVIQRLPDPLPHFEVAG